MLRSICVLVLAMSAFAGSLAADTQQQCSDVVPDVNLARNDPPKEFEGVTITGNKMTLKTGYSFVRVPGGGVAVQETATRRTSATYGCGCHFGGVGGCNLWILNNGARCEQGTCTGACAFDVQPDPPTGGGGQPGGGARQRAPDEQIRR